MPVIVVVFSHRTADNWSLFEVLMHKDKQTEAYKKRTSFFLLFFSHVSTPPRSWSYQAVDPELPGGQFKRSSQADCWENAPFLFPHLSLERRQHLLTWPYLSQMLEGTGYFDNSTTCISFIFCSNISPQLSPCSLTLFLLHAHQAVSRGMGNGLLALYSRRYRPAQKPVTALGGNQRIRQS